MDERDDVERFTPKTESIARAIMAIMAEAGLDPTPPIDPRVLSSTGVKVFRSRYLLPHQMLVMGEFDRPDGWADLSEERKIEEALKRGAIICIYDDRE